MDAIEGEEMLFEAVSGPTYGPEGNQIGTVTVMRDVTDLRRADQELWLNYDKLREAEEMVRQDSDRLNLIIENVGDPIVVCDSAAQDRAGGSRLPRNCSGPPRTRRVILFWSRTRTISPTTSAHLPSHSPNARPPRFVFTTPRVKQVIEYDARSGKIFDERGQVLYTVTVLRDLTALRKVEQLKVERRMLEIEKFAATGRLAATIAHEVNNPMEAIKNAIYLLAGAVPESAIPVYNILEVRNRTCGPHCATDAGTVPQYGAGQTGQCKYHC